jgi:DNA-binding MarR family transcriptional regulator
MTGSAKQSRIFRGRSVDCFVAVLLAMTSIDNLLSIWINVVMSARTDSEELTALVLEIFRVNGTLISAGDRLVADLGLTSARWQVLGAIALSPTPEPVARLARAMGLHRQGVQRIVNELEAEGIVALADNPHHRRARLVRLTRNGEALYREANRRQKPWARNLAKALDTKTIASAQRLLQSLREHLEQALEE